MKIIRDSGKSEQNKAKNTTDFCKNRKKNMAKSWYGHVIKSLVQRPESIKSIKFNI